MRTIRFVTLLSAAIAFTAVSSGLGVTHAAQRPTLAAHRLPADPHGPAFRFGLKGGFSTVGSFTVTLFVDGRVKLQKFQAHSTIRLTNPQVKIYPIALTALLTLAQAEGFFAMPARIVAKRPISDLSEAFISTYTTTGVKTVSVFGVNSARFYELYALLNYVAGATS